MASEDDANFKVKLIDVCPTVRKVKVNSSVSMAHKLALKKVQPSILFVVLSARALSLREAFRPYGKITSSMVLCRDRLFLD